MRRSLRRRRRTETPVSVLLGRRGRPYTSLNQASHSVSIGDAVVVGMLAGFLREDIEFLQLSRSFVAAYRSGEYYTYSGMRTPVRYRVYERMSAFSCCGITLTRSGVA